MYLDIVAAWTLEIVCSEVLEEGDVLEKVQGPG